MRRQIKRRLILIDRSLTMHNLRHAVLERLPTKQLPPGALKNLGNDDALGFAFNNPVAHGGPAAYAQVFIFVAFRKDQQEPFTYRH